MGAETGVPIQLLIDPPQAHPFQHHEQAHTHQGAGKVQGLARLDKPQHLAEIQLLAALGQHGIGGEHEDGQEQNTQNGFLLFHLTPIHAFIRS